MRHYIISLLSAIFVTAVSTGCSDELPVSYDYTVAGQEVTVTVPVSLPKMEVKSRADLDNPGLNHVESLWVAVYSAGAGGAMTSEGWTKLTPRTEDTEVAHEVTLKAKSGPSFIVAVANVDNMGVTRNSDGGPSEEQPLSTLLEAADTWEKFLAIAVVTPHKQSDVNAPTPPLPMAGAYTNLKVGIHSIPLFSEWSTENFISYFIPASTNGTVKLEDGAIHMRRTVSQIKFNIEAGNDKIKVTPHSYRIVNVPVYSWLYERGKNNGNQPVDFREANFGDACTNSNPEDASYKTNYYASPGAYGQSFITNNLNAQGVSESYTFSFWQGENKHTAISIPADYAKRDLQYKEEEDDKGITANSGLFTYLVGGTENSHSWTSNNMASYVIINCTIDYNEEITVDSEGRQPDNGGYNSDESSPVHRSAVANYMIHLGSVNRILSDFNCYRNVQYTYNVTINGVNDIRVEAFTEGENPETPDVEGTVTDVANASVLLDCHYHAYNVYLTDNDLLPWSEDAGITKGFGFLITTYDNLNGGEKTYSEDILKSYDTFDDIPDAEQKYLNWVEFRPTTAENVLAKYKPRGMKDDDGISRTFNLMDAAKGIPANQKSSSHWYTVFVNEYTYECPNANERTDANNGKTVWHSYVDADPRRYYIKVTRATSKDGESIYVRSKYAGTQRSILSYYNPALTAESKEPGQVTGSAIGVECENEVFGLNLRRSFVEVRNEVNGRWNMSEFTKYEYVPDDRWERKKDRGSWDYFLDQTQPQYVPGYQINKFGNYPARTEKLPRITNYRGTFKNYGDNNTSGNVLMNGFSNYDPQPNSPDRNVYIEAINACMNRNRDNNGDGYIDASEMRWYVPATGKYLRIILGRVALQPYPLVNYDAITSMPYGANRLNGPFLFFSSDGRILWAMECMASSYWCHRGFGKPMPPWQVRCIRNLGTNLGEVLEDDQTVPAYGIESGGTYTKIFPTYYNPSTLRVNRYEGNGTKDGQMPVHSLANSKYNTIYRGGFEVYSHYSNNMNGSWNGHWMDLMNAIYSDTNPCNTLTADGGGWRLPNVSELAIMRNLGLITRDWTLSCSMGAFNDQGTKVTPEESQNTVHFYMTARTDLITQEANDNYTILCVRDLR